MRVQCGLLLVALVACSQAQPLYKAPTANPPQFILFTHDDGLDNRDTAVVLDISNKYRNPSGCRVPVTWFACTQGCSGFSCQVARDLFKRGHEIADHTVNHPDLRLLPKKAIRAEIVGARTTLVQCGIPRAAIQGFRTPYLSDKPEVRQVLSEQGFRYDSTIGTNGGPNRPWPAKLNNGIPYNCSKGGNLCLPTERYPNLWEVPLYETPDMNLMDQCTNESTGVPTPGCDPFNVFRQSFDNAYHGGRGPVFIPIHTPYMQNKRFHAAVDKFLGYALSKKDVWAVTISTFLDWMERPVPAKQMKRFMAKYTCT